MARYNPRRSQQEWLQLITECRQSGMADNAWCERHNIPLSSFYNAVARLRKKACAIPESAAPSDSLYTLDFTSHQDVVRVGIGGALLHFSVLHSGNILFQAFCKTGNLF